MSISISEFFKTTQLQLTRRGRWVDATRLIHRMLGLTQAKPQPRTTPPQRSAEPTATVTAKTATALKEQAPVEAPAIAPPAKRPRPASFTEHVFEFADASYDYRLFVPSSASAAISSAAPPLPLIVLLHGCKQDAADFAQGTAMNELAEQHQCLVLYAEQLSEANRMRCWNWFDTAHQMRDAGEPAMIAALTRSIVNSHHADPARVYIAGLSAGGAMAAVVAALYPEMFAAVGVHSGLPPGAATGVMSALSAMRRGARKTDAGNGHDAFMPTIVFHGGADKTVHPDNGELVTDAALAAFDASGVALEKTQHIEGSPNETDGSRDATRTIYSAADGKPYVEHWVIETGPHAWSGGNPAGSFTDPEGPDASRAMLDFFLQHHK
ncbi:PHB depolymerase family esterase [Polaromonas sp. P1-6]|nr:PHB depolymerase family esterase [Polaromonas sp. P1-6]